MESIRSSGRVYPAGQNLPKGIERLGNYLYTRQGGHKIGIAIPTGDDVPVKMPREPRTTDSPQIESHIEPFSAKLLTQEGNQTSNRGGHFQVFCGGEAFEAPNMATWRYEQVAVVVGVAVQNRQARFPSGNHEATSTVGVGDRLTDEALAIGIRQEVERRLRDRWPLVGGLDIAQPPGGPDSLVLAHRVEFLRVLGIVFPAFPRSLSGSSGLRKSFVRKHLGISLGQGCKWQPVGGALASSRRIQAVEKGM